jgi:hypothetical protein
VVSLIFIRQNMLRANLVFKNTSIDESMTLSSDPASESPRPLSISPGKVAAKSVMSSSSSIYNVCEDCEVCGYDEVYHPATHKCFECSEYMCVSVAGFHCKTRATTGHHVTLLTSDVSYSSISSIPVLPNCVNNNKLSNSPSSTKSLFLIVMNCQQSNSLNLSLSGTGRPRNATLTSQGSPDRKVAKAQPSSIVNASSMGMSSMQVSHFVGNALLVSHMKPI